MHMLRFYAFDTLLCLLQITFCFNEVPDVFARTRDFTHSASMLKVWWNIRPTFNVEKSKAT